MPQHGVHTYEHQNNVLETLSTTTLSLALCPCCSEDEIGPCCSHIPIPEETDSIERCLCWCCSHWQNFQVQSVSQSVHNVPEPEQTMLPTTFSNELEYGSVNKWTVHWGQACSDPCRGLLCENPKTRVKINKLCPGTIFECSHLSTELDFGIVCARILARVRNVKAPSVSNLNKPDIPRLCFSFPAQLYLWTAARCNVFITWMIKGLWT